MPAVTGLCRKHITSGFELGERIAYFTFRTQRLAAILKIENRFDDHGLAAEWYRSESLPLPRNLLVDGNPPVPYDVTCGFYKQDDGTRVRPDPAVGRTKERLIEEWDALYRVRRDQWPHVLVCRRVYADVNDPPPRLNVEALKRVFGTAKLPGTQTPKKVPESVIDGLASELGLSLVIVPADDAGKK